MKFQITKERLAYLIDRAIKTVAKRDFRDILKNFVIDVTENRLTVLSFDLELGSVVSTELENSEPGIAVVSAEKLMGIVKAVDRNTVLDVVLGENGLVVSAKGSKWILKTRDPEDFPRIPEFEETNCWSMKSDTFVKGLKAVYKGCANDLPTKVLSAVCISHEGFFASDNVKAYGYAVPISVEKPILVYREAARFLVDAVSGDDVLISESDDFIMFRTDSDFFFVLKVEGEVKNYWQRSFGEVDGGVRLELSAKEFLGMINKVSVCAEDKVGCVEYDGTILRVSAEDRSGNISESMMDLPGEGAFSKLFDFSTVAEMLNLVDSDKILVMVYDLPAVTVLRIVADAFRSIVSARVKL